MYNVLFCAIKRNDKKYSKKAYDECAGSLEFMPYMDGDLVSFRAGRTKPDPKMYTMFLEEYKLRGEECIFIDDTEENVSAATAIGFNGIVFKGLEELAAALRGFDIIVPGMEAF